MKTKWQLAAVQRGRPLKELMKKKMTTRTPARTNTGGGYKQPIKRNALLMCPEPFTHRHPRYGKQFKSNVGRVWK